MESQPQNPEFRINPETFTHVIETPFSTFANRADPDQAAIFKSCLIRVYSVCLRKYI